MGGKKLTAAQKGGRVAQAERVEAALRDLVNGIALVGKVADNPGREKARRWLEGLMNEHGFRIVQSEGNSRAVSPDGRVMSVMLTLVLPEDGKAGGGTKAAR